MAERPWTFRHGPRAHELDLGVRAGVLFPGSDLALRARNAPAGGYGFVASTLGVDLTYFPSDWLGLRGAGWLTPTRYAGASALLYSARAQFVAQRPGASIVPFVAIGGGALGVRGERTGRDVDIAFALSGGVRVNLDRRWQLGLEVLDLMSDRADGPDGEDHRPAHSVELTLSAAVRFDISVTAPSLAPPPDRDGDGIPDGRDHCPFEAGDDPRGCPWGDMDRDGWRDPDDACPTQPGSGPDGCPAPDGDGDGVADAADRCPRRSYRSDDGCPPADADDDGIVDLEDDCPDQAEVINGYEDRDGCPDRLPRAVRELEGVVAWMRFRPGREDLVAGAADKLTRWVEVLEQYPHLRMHLEVHVDAKPGDVAAQALSDARARALARALEAAGVAPNRIWVVGRGAGHPIASNHSRKGRAANRRVELSFASMPRT